MVGVKQNQQYFTMQKTVHEVEHFPTSEAEQIKENPMNPNQTLN